MPVRVVRMYEAPRRIAIIKPSALGDIMHALPTLTALRRRFPHAHIAWVVNGTYAALLERHPDIDAVMALDRAAMRRSWLKGGVAFTRFLRHLRRQRYDLVIDLQGLLRS